MRYIFFSVKFAVLYLFPNNVFFSQQARKQPFQNIPPHLNPSFFSSLNGAETAPMLSYPYYPAVSNPAAFKPPSSQSSFCNATQANLMPSGFPMPMISQAAPFGGYSGYTLIISSI